MCIGPLAFSFDDRAVTATDDPLQSWLDSFPNRSVLYVSFGSAYNPDANQLRELAIAISALPNQVLWSLRSPFIGQQGYDEHGLPNDLQYSNVRIEQWVNQRMVLAHKSVGAFMTHCGWNSTLEACIAGMPMVCCPLVAEQHLNTVLVAKIWHAGESLRESGDKLKTPAEMTAVIRRVLETPEYAENAARAGQQCRDNAQRSQITLTKFLALSKMQPR